MSRLSEPTLEQKDTLWRVVNQLTNFYVSIHLARIDQRSERMIILAGDEFVIEVQKDGVAEYL